MSSNYNYSRSLDQVKHHSSYFSLLKDEINRNMYRSSPCVEFGIGECVNKNQNEEVSELRFLLEEACRDNDNFNNGTSFGKNKLYCPPTILTSGDGKYINLSLSNYEMAREVDINTLDNGRIDPFKDPELQDLLGSFEREGDEGSFLKKLRGEEDFSSSLSNSLGSEVTISRESSSIFRDDLLFSRNETPGLVGTDDALSTGLEGSVCEERMNLLVQKCNKSDVERYTLSFQDESSSSIAMMTQPSGNKLADQEHNVKNGNFSCLFEDDHDDLPVNLRRSTVNRCMNEQVLRDEIASPVMRTNMYHGIFLDEDRKNGLIKMFTSNQGFSPSSSGKGDSSMSVTSQESSPGSSDTGARSKGQPTVISNYRKTFEELERQETNRAAHLQGFGKVTSQKSRTEEPFDVYLSESALEEFESNSQNWLRRASLMSTKPKVIGKAEVSSSRQFVTPQEGANGRDTKSPRIERPTSFSKKSRNHSVDSSDSSDTIYVCYPNYSLPDMSFVQKIIGQSSPGLVLSPTKPQLRQGTGEAKRKGTKTARPKSFGGYERLSRENFSHIKDWDSLNVLLPDDLKKLLNESPSCAAQPPLPSFQGGVGLRHRNRNRTTPRSHRFSLQEPLIATIGEEEDEESRNPGLARNVTGCNCNRVPPRSPHSNVWLAGNNHCCHHVPILPSPQMLSHCHTVNHCCPSGLRESQMESLSKEKLNKLLSMSDALEEITSLLTMVTSLKNTPSCMSKTSSVSSGDNEKTTVMRRNMIKKPRPVSMSSCGFKSQIPVIKPAVTKPIVTRATPPKIPPRKTLAARKI